MSWAWSYLLAGLGCFALWLAGRKRKSGWAVGASIQVLWVAYAVSTRQYGFIISAFAYGFFYVRNYLRWRAEETKAA